MYETFSGFSLLQRAVVINHKKSLLSSQHNEHIVLKYRNDLFLPNSGLIPKTRASYIKIDLKMPTVNQKDFVLITIVNS